MPDCSPACVLAQGEARVASWQCPRKVTVMPCAVAVEIAMSGCYPCPTCQKRVDDCKATLDSKGEKYEALPVNGGITFVFPQPEEPKLTPAEVCSFLSEKLNLAVVPA